MRQGFGQPFIKLLRKLANRLSQTEGKGKEMFIFHNTEQLRYEN